MFEQIDGKSERRRWGFLAVAVCICMVAIVAVTPASAQQIKFPTDGNGVLDYCSQVINNMDNPSSSSPVRFDYWIKQGWCAGHIQTMREMVVYWQVQVVKSVFVLNGDMNPSEDKIKALMLSSSEMTCIPNEAGPGQLVRVLVKWLRGNPGRLHEPPSILTVDAFHDSFPCHVDSTPKRPTTN